MIKREFYKTRNDGVDLYRTFSGIEQDDGTVISSGLLIRKIETGELYDEAIDVDGAPYTYEETDLPIEPEEIDKEEVNVDVYYD